MRLKIMPRVIPHRLQTSSGLSSSNCFPPFTMGNFFDTTRCAIIANSLLVNAGVEKRTLELAQYLKMKGRTVEVYILRQTGKIAALFEEAGVPVRFIPVYAYTEDERNYRFHPLGFLRLMYWLLRGRFGLVFCVQPPSSLFGRMACFPPLGRRIVAMERFLIGRRSARRQWLERWMAGWSRVVCVSTLLRDQLVASGLPAGRVTVIENGVSVAPPMDLQVELRARLQGRFVIGCVGLFAPRKRQGVLLEAFARLVAARPALRPVLIFVGGGETETELRRRVRELRIEEDVIFAGEQSHVHDFYRLFDAFVFPSVEEGMGSVWAEAMQHGLPVVCADVRPMNDYIRHGGNGLLARPDDAGSFCHEMLRLGDSVTLREELGQRGQNFACEHFQRDRQLEKLHSFALGS